ncbi:uncharacterized protein Pyn_06027 [Prunus yedoensis var. nudiflora]|uniref:Uncharacterized protein n=1 Tax=Prunus yedoensis var. nudiflora TaxID=2094558 RepID=A0A314YZB7_PRUYE|nr:uncharacterized protein Pyn_06027 [Prunus yedoensis var. nudiflora]
MVGAVTAALGASALLVENQGSYKGDENSECSSNSLMEGNGQREPESLRRHYLKKTKIT